VVPFLLVNFYCENKQKFCSLPCESTDRMNSLCLGWDDDDDDDDDVFFRVASGSDVTGHEGSDVQPGRCHSDARPLQELCDQEVCACVCVCMCVCVCVSNGFLFAISGSSKGSQYQTRRHTSTLSTLNTEEI